MSNDVGQGAVAVIKQAIRAKQSIEAVYQGHPRVLSPHALGWKGDEYHLIAYQTGGTSKSGPLVPGSDWNWRCMRVAELIGVRPSSDPFQSVSLHKKPNTCIDRIDVEVSH